MAYRSVPPMVFGRNNLFTEPWQKKKRKDNKKFEVPFKQMALNKTRETVQAVVDFIKDEIREKGGVVNNR